MGSDCRVFHFLPFTLKTLTSNEGGKSLQGEKKAVVTVSCKMNAILAPSFHRQHTHTHTQTTMSANAISNGMIGTQLGVWKHTFCRFSLSLLYLRTFGLNDWTAFFHCVGSYPLNQQVHFLSSSCVWLARQVIRNTEETFKTGKFWSESWCFIQLTIHLSQKHQVGAFSEKLHGIHSRVLDLSSVSMNV